MDCHCKRRSVRLTQSLDLLLLALDLKIQFMADTADREMSVNGHDEYQKVYSKVNKLVIDVCEFSLGCFGHCGEPLEPTQPAAPAKRPARAGA